MFELSFTSHLLIVLYLIKIRNILSNYLLIIIPFDKRLFINNGKLTKIINDYNTGALF